MLETSQTANGHPLRVGFLTPSLMLGGAERWMIMLANHCDRGAISWVGTALTDGAWSETRLCRELRRSMPIYGGPSYDGAGHDPCFVTRLPTAAEGIATVAAEADMIIAWGVPYLGSLLGQVAGRVILVSHGTGEWTCGAMRQSERDATDLAAVSEAARMPFSVDVRPRVRVLHNGAEADRCAPGRGRTATRTQWGFGPDHRLIGHVGRLSPEKNPLAAAQAAQRLGGHWRAIYVGSGWYEAEIRAGAWAVAGDRVRFVPPMARVGDALAALDVLVLASREEGFSLALTEAWLAGLPAVATRVGAVPELERIHGRLVVPVPVDPTPDQLAEAVEVALEPANRDVMDRAHRVAWAHFTATAMAARWTDYLLELSGCPRRATASSGG